MDNELGDIKIRNKYLLNILSNNDEVLPKLNCEESYIVTYIYPNINRYEIFNSSNSTILDYVKAATTHFNEDLLFVCNSIEYYNQASVNENCDFNFMIYLP